MRTLDLIPKTGQYDALVNRVRDGDTLDVCLLVPVTVRVFGIQAAELRTDKGKLVADVVRGRLEKQIVTLTLHGTDKYGRTLAEVSVNGKDLGAELLAEGLAVAWNGQGPRPVGQSDIEGA